MKSLLLINHVIMTVGLDSKIFFVNSNIGLTETEAYFSNKIQGIAADAQLSTIILYIINQKPS